MESVTMLLCIPLALLALGNMQVSIFQGSVKVKIGKIDARDDVMFAYQFPAVKPIINISLKRAPLSRLKNI